MACIPFGAVLASPVHGIFMPLGSKVLEYQQAPVRSPSDLPRVLPSHKPAWARIADPAAEHTRLSTASRANIEWLLQCFQADLACPLQSKPILACKAAAEACAEGTKIGIGLVYIQPLRLMVRRNVGLPGSRAAVALPHQGGPTLHSVLRNLGPARAHANRLDRRGPSSARHMHAFRHRQHRIRSRSEQAVHDSTAFANFCAIGRRMGLQAQMVSTSLAYPRRAQRVG